MFIPLLPKAADMGNAEAQTSPGVCFDRGNGVEQDCEEAVKYYRLATEQGYPSVQYNLGMNYYFGDGVFTRRN